MMAIPPRDTCLMIAAGELDLARQVRPDGNPAWAAAHAAIAHGYLALAAAQDEAFNPEDAASWTPDLDSLGG